MKTNKPSCKLIKFKTRDEWLTARTFGITATASGAILGVNPWETPLDIYLRIVHGVTKQIDETELIAKGNQAEPILRDLFRLNYGDKYKLKNPPKSNWMLVRTDKLYMMATPDGLMTEKGTRRKGGIECKYHLLRGAKDEEMWKQGQLPQQYYCQVLHTMNVGMFDFYFVAVLLEHQKKNANGEYEFDFYETRFYFLDRIELRRDLKYEADEMDKFWHENIVARTIPDVSII